MGTSEQRESEFGPVKLTGTYRKLVKDTTINDTTLLSTDYLNHYNELVMMLEMVPDMPDMLMEAEAWAPKTYQEHFKDSTFQHKDLAIWAYEQAPEEYRVPMDDCIARMDGEITDGIPKLREFADLQDMDRLSVTALSLTAALRDRIDTMSALINGAMDAEGYKERVETAAPTDTGEVTMDQADIDALFD